jgi:hypothetical protein
MLNYFIELDNVGVSHFFKDVDFTGYAFHIGLVFDLVLFEYLNSHLLICDRMCTDSNFAESSLTQRFT